MSDKFIIACNACKSTDCYAEFMSEGTTINCRSCEADAEVGNNFNFDYSTIPFEISCSKCQGKSEVDHWYMNTEDTGPVGGSRITCNLCDNEDVLAE